MPDALLSNGHDLSVPDSPAIDSPATPVDAINNDNDIKIDDHDHEESDVRHDPFPLKLDNASTVPQIATPIDPCMYAVVRATAFADTFRAAVIPISPPKGTPPPAQGDLLEDVKMAEASPPPAEPATVVDVHMADAGEDLQSEPQLQRQPTPKTDSPNPSSLVAVSSSTAAVESVAAGPSSPYHNISPNDDDIQPPPAKRARMHTDPDQASIANVRLFRPCTPLSGRADPIYFVSLSRSPLKTATPPPVTPSPSPPAIQAINGHAKAVGSAPAPAPAPVPAPTPPAMPSVLNGRPMSVAQYRFCLSTIRSLKRMKAAGPFLYPVDPVALNIPHYPSVIKHPMDFSTVERKLNSSNPVKPDPNPVNPRYKKAEEFIADVRLIFTNSVTFNGPEHPVTTAGKQVEEVFDRQMKNLPPPEEVSNIHGMLSCSLTFLTR